MQSERDVISFASGGDCLGDELIVAAGPGPEFEHGEGQAGARLLTALCRGAEQELSPWELRATPKRCFRICFLVAVG